MRFFLVFLASFLLFSLSDAHRCGQVFDGKNAQDLDLLDQSESDLSVSWAGFEEGTQVEWGIVSADKFIPRPDCDYQDMQPTTPWVSVSSSPATLSLSSLSLTPGHTYFSLLRATTPSGRLLFAHSNGFSLTKTDLHLRDLEEIEDLQNLEANFVNSPTNKDDDDDLENWQIGLIALACFLFVLLLAGIVVAIALKGRGGDKYNTNVHRNENVERI